MFHFQKLKNPFFFPFWTKISFKNIEIFFHEILHFYGDFCKIMPVKVVKTVKNMCLFDFFQQILKNPSIFFPKFPSNFKFPSHFLHTVILTGKWKYR